MTQNITTNDALKNLCFQAENFRAIIERFQNSNFYYNLNEQQKISINEIANKAIMFPSTIENILEQR
ncbi:MAG: hypothetical protein WC365_09300 [Candidatus Babeliales bacterium]|jgi:hypothetical protein